MGNVTPLLSRHPLVGRWRTEEDDGRSEYTVSVVPSGLSVKGCDFLDGEEFLIWDVKWTENSVEFKTNMPSTGRRGHIVLTFVQSLQTVTMTYTFTDTCVAYKADER
ncbi:hypothetical protein SAMN02927923_04129 [Microvirga guangxiensis]|uniref:Uncharacterized protein n=1 Tax=Microvirga guangxiensis TaxID=549386 RepID=A0A1G5LB99_9HYPH|nr:hypothetical protein SAMN02927923_04129 [Microvirga guangxiensis]